MGRKDPIRWSDFTDEAMNHVIGHLIVRRGATPEHATDITNEAAGQLVRRRVIPRNVEALLRVAATNLLASDRRHQATRREQFGVAEYDHAAEHPVEDGFMAMDTSDPAVLLANAEHKEQLLRKVRAALDKLPPNDKMLLTAFYFEGRKLGEFDAPLGLRPNGANVVASRARQRMRSILKADQVTAEDVP